ncbi:hypothetical protein [[Flexibacter] sp. ATCC 35208]|uniref:hypothetical protein n=1 Tax=[Flexibacter] sp. ATCC 35208 TaxID=1936242 RepID=UPI0015C3D019|nr:hypothetical protein [[Flexibacter] sp. ATCC 35208]
MASISMREVMKSGLCMSIPVTGLNWFMTYGISGYRLVSEFMSDLVSVSIVIQYPLSD